MSILQWSYVDPMAMVNIEAERRELGLDRLQRRVARPAPSAKPASIDWWARTYEQAGRTLLLQGSGDNKGR